MLRVGIVGIGFIGHIHYLAYQKVRGTNVVAICEQYAKRLTGDWRDIKGNFGPPGAMMDLSGVATYSQIDELLADPDVDLVDICLPPALHADATIAALKAGKDVFCEKPISIQADDARRMVAAAKQTGRKLYIGHVLPFFPEYQFVQQTVASGKYGKLLGGHFKRVISDPLWLPNFYDPQKVGGPLIDLHIHDAHFIRLLCGMPYSVYSRGRLRGGVVSFAETQFMFDDPQLLISSTSGVIDQQGRSFTSAFEIHLERATLLFDFAVIDGQGCVLQPLTVLTGDKVLRPKLAGGDPVDGFVNEIKHVQKCLNDGSESPLLGAQLARDALALCHAQTKSVISRRTVKVAS